MSKKELIERLKRHKLLSELKWEYRAYFLEYDPVRHELSILRPIPVPIFVRLKRDAKKLNFNDIKVGRLT